MGTALVAPAAPSPIMQTKEVAALTTPQALALLQPLLPKGVAMEQVLSEVVFAIQKDPALAECTPASLVQSVAKCIREGLVIGEKIHLVRFNTKVKVKNKPDLWEARCQAIRDYKGDAELAIRAGACRAIDAFNFYESELFEYELGSHPFVKHRPKSPLSRGKLVGAYAVAHMGAITPPKIIVMYRDEIDAIRMSHSKQWKTKWENGQQVPLPLDEIPWYGPKTCTHQLIKLLPSTPALTKLYGLLDTELAEVVEDEPLDPSMRVESGQPEPAAVASGSVATAAPMSGEKGGGRDAASPLTARSDTPAPASSPASAPADNDGVSAAAADMTEDAADNYCLPGKPSEWGGNGGKPLRMFKRGQLQAWRDWAAKKLLAIEEQRLEENPVLQEFVENVDTVLAARRAADAQDPRKNFSGPTTEDLLQASVDATKPTAAPIAPIAATSGPVDMPKGGAIEGAFSVPQQPKPIRTRPTTTTTAGAAAPAKTLMQLTREIQELLSTANRTDDEKAKTREQLDTATTIAELEAIVTDLQQPF